MQTQYGVELLLNVVLGKDLAQVSQIASGMLQLKNSREHEKEADEYSVKYLCPTPYNAAGAAGFFTKLEASGIQCGGIQQFFSTHPCPDNRIANIATNKTTEGCTGTGTFDAEYANFKALLP
jgi:predicted Zn-dependent protease